MEGRREGKKRKGEDKSLEGGREEEEEREGLVERERDWSFGSEWREK